MYTYDRVVYVVISNLCFDIVAFYFHQRLGTVVFMKQVFVVFLLVTFYSIVSPAFAAETMSLEDAEILLSKVKSDRDSFVQASFEGLVKQYSALEPRPHPEVIKYMAACTADKITSAWASMTSEELVSYSTSPELSNRIATRVSGECWQEMQTLVK